MFELLIAALREAGDGWLSGAELARRAGVSRAAVWKQMEQIRAAGYVLEAHPRLGYRLVSAPDAVTPAEIQPGLTTARFGHPIHYCESCPSTNDLAKSMARTGAPEGLVVIADEQTAGRGRMGRAWTTPKGSALAMSLVLRPALAPHEAPRITLAAAVAVAEAVRAVTGIPASIKWPNDVQVDGLKLCGILTEMEAEVERIAFVVLGIGLNVNVAREQMPEPVRETATSLLLAGGRTYLRAPLAQAILGRLESVYDDLLAGRFAGVLDRWRALSATLGRSVRVLSTTGERILEGEAEEVDAEGALLIRTPEGVLQRVLAGEVSLRPVSNS